MYTLLRLRCHYAACATWTCGEPSDRKSSNNLHERFCTVHLGWLRKWRILKGVLQNPLRLRAFEISLKRWREEFLTYFKETHMHVHTCMCTFTCAGTYFWWSIRKNTLITERYSIHHHHQCLRGPSRWRLHLVYVKAWEKKASPKLSQRALEQEQVAWGLKSTCLI